MQSSCSHSTHVIKALLMTSASFMTEIDYTPSTVGGGDDVSIWRGNWIISFCRYFHM